ncbi:MAG TPA: hypothetical protein VFC19_04065 [Candidatus Limnocylindrales bacterium]|nr:hypothetical protein [Candidatus Limnocylindrales bacterium]
MGLALRYNIFHHADPKAVYGLLHAFWEKRGHRIVEGPREFNGYVLHHERNGWTLLNWSGGWEWKLRREAQLRISRLLNCTGLLVFVYDGRYWGYELFHQGVEVDHFVQKPEEHQWFPGRDCAGRAEAFQLLDIPPADIAPHLRNTSDANGFLEFLATLGVGLELREGYYTPLAKPWREFKIVPI